MGKKTSKRIVIDASVARAAGETQHPTSRSCREFLQAILDVCHRAVFTPAITEEWNRHQSLYARRWRATMTAKKKIAEPPQGGDGRAVGEEIAEGLLTERERNALLKDMHLVDAALRTDGMVASLDDEARRILRKAASSWPPTRRLVWVNPGVTDEQCVDWARKGALSEPARRIAPPAAHD